MTTELATRPRRTRMPEADARRLTERIKVRLGTIETNATKVLAALDRAFTRRVWLSLGYKTWEEYAVTEFSNSLQSLNVALRRQVVTKLGAQGMSSRAIGPVVGVSDRQARRDQVGHDVPRESVLGRDGKRYSTARKRTKPKTYGATYLQSVERVTKATEELAKQARRPDFDNIETTALELTRERLMRARQEIDALLTRYPQR